MEVGTAFGDEQTKAAAGNTGNIARTLEGIKDPGLIRKRNAKPGKD